MNERLEVKHLEGLKWMLKHDYVHQMDRVWIAGVIKELEAQQQAHPATHSEDGREVAEVTVCKVPSCERSYGFGYVDGSCHVDLRKYRNHLEDILDSLPNDEPLMAVAQHERILKAKDAALVELINSRNCYQWEFERVSAELEQLRAQPARQVGGDEPVAELKCEECGGHGQIQIGEEGGSWMQPPDPVYEVCQSCGGEPVAVVDCSDDACWADILDDRTVKVGQKLYAHPAALAPAAVVMPEPFAWAEFDGEGCYDLRLYEENETFHADYIAKNGEKYRDWVWPLLRADEVARLNRRAIPAGLLERLCEPGEHHITKKKLRALLGKDGE